MIVVPNPVLFLESFVYFSHNAKREYVLFNAETWQLVDLQTLVA